MSNGLTALDNTMMSRDYQDAVQMENRFKNQGISSGKSFKELFEEKLNRDGSVNQSRLDKKEKKLYNSCVDMESLFWKQILNEMKKTVNQHKLLDGGQGEEIFTDFLYDEYASMMSKNAGTHISDAIFKQLSGYR
jgi:Rod binding domain-containing protein